MGHVAERVLCRIILGFNSACSRPIVVLFARHNGSGGVPGVGGTSPGNKLAYSNGGNTPTGNIGSGTYRAMGFPHSSVYASLYVRIS